jgi:hypothetical protein
MSKKSIIIPRSNEGLLSDINMIEPYEDGFRTCRSSGAFEWWYFDVKLIDGSTLVMVFSTKPLLEHKGKLNPGVSLTITYPNGQRISKFSRFPSNQFFASTDTCDVHIGSNWIQGDLHRYNLHIHLDNLIVNLTFYRLVSPWRPGTGKIYFGDDKHYFAWLLPIPYGKVKGSLSNYGQIQYLRGTGYHDHNWGNIRLDKVLNRWIWGRAHIGIYTLIFAEQIAAKAYDFQQIPIFLLVKGNHVITDDASKLRVDIKNYVQLSIGREYPHSIDFHWQKDSDNIRITIREPQVIEMVDRLNNLPKWQRGLLRFVTKPYYFRFKATLELSINIGSVSEIVRGDVLYELMYFR